MSGQRKAGASKPKRCQECSRAKAKCNRSFPCSRCFMHCTACVPTDRPMSVPYLNLALSSFDAPTAQDLLVGTFSSLYTADCMDQGALLAWMRSLQRLGVPGGDISGGFASTVSQACGFTPEQLGCVVEAAPGPMGQVPWGGTPHARSEGLAGCESFRKLDDGLSALVVVSYDSEGVCVGLNSLAVRHLFTAREVHEAILAHGVMFEHVLASLVYQEDWPDFYECVVRMCERPYVPHLRFLKMVCCDGSISLFIARFRRLSFPELPPGAFSYSIRLERAPPSRHVTRRPGYGRYITESFRQGHVHARFKGPNPPPAWRLPGITCLPIGPVPEEAVGGLEANAGSFARLPTAACVSAAASSKVKMPPFEEAGGVFRGGGHPVAHGGVVGGRALGGQAAAGAGPEAAEGVDVWAGRLTPVLIEGNTHPLFGEVTAADGPAALTQEEPIGAVDLDALLPMTWH